MEQKEARMLLILMLRCTDVAGETVVQIDFRVRLGYEPRCRHVTARSFEETVRGSWITTSQHHSRPSRVSTILLSAVVFTSLPQAGSSESDASLLHLSRFINYPAVSSFMAGQRKLEEDFLVLSMYSRRRG